MRWKFILGTVILIAGIYLAVSPMLKQSTPELVAGKTPVEILTEIRNSKEPKSFKYRSDVEAGGNMTINLTGRVSRENKEELLDFSWEGPQGYGEASAYFKDKMVLLYHPLKNKWLTPSEEPALGSLIKMLVGQVALLNPYKSLERIDLSEAKIGETGNETVNGLETTVIEVEPGAKADEWFRGILPPQLIGAKVSEVKQIYWVGNHDLRIHKYLMTAKIKILALQVFEFRIRTTVEDFNDTEVKKSPELEKKIKQSGV